MKLELIYAKDLNWDEIKELNRLSFRSNGQLMYELEDYRHQPDARVIRLRDATGRVLSWGLVHKVHKAKKKNKEDPSYWRWDFQVYTRASERCKGYGTLIYRKAVQVAHGRDRLIVHPHSTASDAYFDKVHFDEYGKVRKPKRKVK